MTTKYETEKKKTGASENGPEGNIREMCLKLKNKCSARENLHKTII